VKAVIFTLRSLSKQIRWEQLADLRHKSIVAHGYAGVSAEDIREAAQMPAGELLDKLRGALQSLDARRRRVQSVRHWKTVSYSTEPLGSGFAGFVGERVMTSATPIRSSR
jgi:hypothetical protein